MQQPQQSQSSEEPSHRSMVEHRQAIERDLRLQRERAAAAVTSFAQSLHSIRSLADETLANREESSDMRRRVLLDEDEVKTKMK